MWYLYTCLVYSCSAWRHIAINYMYLLEDMCCWMIVQHQELGVSGGGSVSSRMEHKAEENLYVKMSNSQSWHPFFTSTYIWLVGTLKGGGGSQFPGERGVPPPPKWNPDNYLQLFFLYSHLMKPCPSDHQKFLDEAAEMSRRRRALQEVTEISDPITPPKKLTYFT